MNIIQMEIVKFVTLYVKPVQELQPHVIHVLILKVKGIYLHVIARPIYLKTQIQGYVKLVMMHVLNVNFHLKTVQNVLNLLKWTCLNVDAKKDIIWMKMGVVNNVTLNVLDVKVVLILVLNVIMVLIPLYVKKKYQKDLILMLINKQIQLKLENAKCNVKPVLNILGNVLLAVMKLEMQKRVVCVKQDIIMMEIQNVKYVIVIVYHVMEVQINA